MIIKDKRYLCLDNTFIVYLFNAFVYKSYLGKQGHAPCKISATRDVLFVSLEFH